MTDAELIPAATVVLLRSTADGTPEVLMLRKNSKIAFGGMWVFPGGAVDDHERVDGDDLASARTAAVREVEEETGLTIDGTQLETWSFWVPPPKAQMRGHARRFATWFFVMAAPDGDVAIDGGEIHEHRWFNPKAALEEHAAGSIELVPPTWITLYQLSHHQSVADGLAWAARTEPLEFRTKPVATDPLTLAWAGDAAYEGGALDQPGPRNRLTMAPGAWRYETDTV